MTRDDAPGLKQALAAAYELYGKQLTRTVFRIWFEALKGYELATITMALSRHCINPDNGQFLPKPADLVKVIEGGSEDAALKAWAMVDRAARSIGPYQTVVFDDPIIHVAIEALGGWTKFGRVSEADWPFIGRNFIALYRGSRGRGLAHRSKLMGLTELDGGNPAPVLIGDHARALEVMRLGAERIPLAAVPARELLPALENRT